MIRRLFIAIAFLLPITTTAKDKKISILPVPAFGYAPETGTYIGAVSLFTFNFYNDSLTRTSNAKLELNYTWRNQIIVETEWNYFFKNEGWFTKGRLHFSKFPDRYYGIGANTIETDEYLYNSNRTIVDAHILKNTGNRLFAGIGIKHIGFRNVTPLNETKYPELKDNKSTGAGISLLKDTRDNLLTPSKGIYISLYSGYVFTKQQYAELTFDSRYYLTHRKVTFAVRWYNDLNFNNAPFYDLALMGGDKYIRGFYYGRYRDNHLSTLQAEVRSVFLWRFGLAAFGGLSNVYSSFDRFAVNNVKYNAGAGIRFLIDRKENINLRLDYAVGSGNNSGFYISFGEAF
ncbi:MAG: hypothetical protein H6551_01010 [Chitinophagales bacterium]|nr:hypothetical protein [Chitinophagaceae bacterium]MCB9063703.1 hypothetical protein [Chitinophagales bacterium]